MGECDADDGGPTRMCQVRRVKMGGIIHDDRSKIKETDGDLAVPNNFARGAAGEGWINKRRKSPPMASSCTDKKAGGGEASLRAGAKAMVDGNA